MAKKSAMRPPIIIIGMHRSGTSMITGILQTLGLFTGVLKDRHHEALYFANMNNWLMRRSGGEWDFPETFRYVSNNKRIRCIFADRLRYFLRTPRVAFFLGLKKYGEYRTVFRLNIPWGWKDPRNTFTLPLWLDVFPNAKVIHIVRHGVDVAASLKERADRRLAVHTSGCRGSLEFFRPRPRFFEDSIRCLSLAGGLSLWKAYVEEGSRQAERLKDRAYTLRYEEFLEEPEAILMDLSRFCGLPLNRGNAREIAGKLDVSRAYAFRNDPVLNEFAYSVSGELSELGYRP